MLEWPEYIEAFVVLLALFNPLGMVPVFLGLTASCTPGERRRIALVGADGSQASSSMTASASIITRVYGGSYVSTHTETLELALMLATHFAFRRPATVNVWPS